MAGNDRVTSRVRVAASACLVASGLFIGAAGGAIALADPGDGYGKQDDSKGGDSIGAIVRRAFGLGDGSDAKSTKPGQYGPNTHWGNGRQGPTNPGEKEPLTADTPTRTTAEATETTTKSSTPPETPCPERADLCTPPGQEPPNPPESNGAAGGGAIVQLPRYKPPSVPDMQLPSELQPSQPGGPAVLDAGAGMAAAAAPVGPAVPIALPVIVAPPIGIGGIGGGPGPGGAAAGAPPALPRAVAEPPAGRISPPANVGSNVAAPSSSYRIGYTEYLRTAGLPQVAALAVSGLFGIMMLTGAGGLLGYRQAKAGHAVHIGATARFMR